MSNSMIQAKYPLLETQKFLEISIGQPERNPKSPESGYRCEYKISAPNFETKRYVYGIDALQCVLLALGTAVPAEISCFEKNSNMKLEHGYFADLLKQEKLEAK